MKKHLLLLTFLSCAATLAAQHNGKRLWGGVELGYGLSITNTPKPYSSAYDTKDITLNSLKATLGYYITPSFSLGAGVEPRSYVHGGLNMVNLWLDSRFHPFKDKKILLNGSLGLPLFLSEKDNRKIKLLADIAFGYELFSIKKIKIMPQIGYDYCHYGALKTPDLGVYSEAGADEKANHSIHCLVFKVGVIF